MKLPEAIQRQVDEAEALEKQLYARPDTSDEQRPANEETPAAAEALPAEDQSSASESTGNDEQSQSSELQAKPGREDNAVYWRDRANALYGVNQQLAEEVRNLRAQTHEFSNELQRLRTAQEQVIQQRNEPSAKDNDAEVFGEDLVEAMDRRAAQRAREMVAQETKPLVDYIRQLEARLGTVDQQVAVSAQDRFTSNLSRLVPDYEAVNADVGFLNWLGEVDSVYGVPRQMALDAAANANDADRVAAIFNAYKLLTGKQATQQQRQQVRQELERQTAPTSTRGANQPASAGKVWSLAEYEAALDPRNIQKMGRQKADDLYMEAERALAEGRVQ